VGAPVTGTSANLTGEPPVSRLSELRLDTAQLAGAIDCGATPGGLPSTLLDLTVEPARILRGGAIPAAELAGSLEGRLV
jgi:L-threonylcarbamoyladenylate synthase